MHRHARILTPVALVAAGAIALSACSTPSSGETAAPDAAATTVVVENAKPTLIEVTEGGETALEEDLETPRGSVEVPFQPASVVTFDIGTLDTLHAIGAGDAVVGIPDIVLPDYLAEYADLPKVGTLFEPDLEAVAELDPELIVVAARSTALYDDLAEITPATIDLTAAYAGAFSPAATIERATQLGEIFGADEVVAGLVAGIEQTEDQLGALAAQAGPTLMVSVSGGEYSAFAEGSRFGYFFDEVGFEPAVAAAQLPGQAGSPHGDVVSNEFILAANPSLILALDRGAAIGDTTGGTAVEVLDNELVAQTPAGADGRIVFLPSSELYIVISGLTGTQNVLDAIVTGLES